jgi:hypothetical protein
MSSTSILSHDRSIRLEAKSTVMLEACRSHNLLWVLTFIVIDLDLESRSLHSAGSQIHGQAWRLAAVESSVAKRLNERVSILKAEMQPKGSANSILTSNRLLERRIDYSNGND